MGAGRGGDTARGVPSATIDSAAVTSVNVGATRSVVAGGRTVQTAIWKASAAGRVMVRGVNVDGDDQADRSVHGGPDKAVYAYAAQDYQWWEAELGRRLEPGTFGENLTISGVAVSDAVIGERWAIGSTVLEVCQPRTPCGKLGLRMGDRRFPRRFARAGRPGAYLRILVEGCIGPGDAVTVVHRPAHPLTVAAVARASEGDSGPLPDMLRAPELAGGWVSWAVDVALERLRRDPFDTDLHQALRARLLLAGIDESRAADLLDGG